MQPTSRPRPTRAQLVVALAMLVAYAVGYPVAIIWQSMIGWGLVTLGGILLLVLGVLTVRRIHASG